MTGLTAARIRMELSLAFHMLFAAVLGLRSSRASDHANDSCG